MKIGVFPGSFDPITIGHESVILRSLPLFDKVILAIGVNSLKQNMFSLDQRKHALARCFSNYSKISVDSYEGLTIEYCKRVNAHHIIRGLRISADFEYERNIALMNRELNPDIETIFLISEPQHSAITSTVVRDIYKNGGDISRFVPKGFEV